MDCIYITVESDRYEKMGREKDKDGHVLRKGYKIAVLANLLPNHKLVTVGVMIFPLTVADITCGKTLMRHILRTHGVGFIKELVMDMGFLDGAWLHDLKQRYHIDVFIPVRENMNILADAVGLARYERVVWDCVRASPRREIALLTGLTTWDSAKLPLNCCLVRDTDANGKVTDWAIVTPKDVKTARAIYDAYSDRWDLEEAFNELTCLWQYDRFYSTKWSLVVGQVFFTFIVYPDLSGRWASSGCGCPDNIGALAGRCRCLPGGLLCDPPRSEGGRCSRPHGPGVLCPVLGEYGPRQVGAQQSRHVGSLFSDHRLAKIETAARAENA